MVLFNAVLSRGPLLLGLVLVVAAALACATTQERPASPSSSDGDEADAEDDAEDEAALEDEGEPPPPSTWAGAGERFEFKCPAPAFTLDEPRRFAAGDVTFVIEGSVARREGSPVEGPITFGVLGALKDAADATRENVRRAARSFESAGVDVVVVNGDLGEDRELEDVLALLGEELSVPVLVHSGNMEWTSAFVRAMAKSEGEHPDLVNLNWVSHVQLGGGVHLLALPGYHDLQFLKAGGCRYSDDDIARLTAKAKELRARGDVVVLTSHGPPLQEGESGLDVAYDDAGHVGDPRITKLLEDGDVTVGLFSHILEAGGRATADPRGKEPVKLPVKKAVPSLYVNAGSASAFGWTLLDGGTSDGMAVVVEVSREGVKAHSLKLR